MNMFKDPVLNKLFKKHGPHKFEDRSKLLFSELVESIISQQLSNKATGTIYNRFLALFKGNEFPTPKAFKTGDLNIQKIKKMPDEEIIATLTKIKGIGKWTAEMILIFTLKRKDVFSLGDAGLKKAVKNLYGITDEKEILKLSESWKPNRSFACWYLWKFLDNAPKT
jgi:DNA-3-methyladenine glycosylase II